jgi:hypothetical protein
MNKIATAGLVVLVASITATAQTARADATDAMCEVRKDGDKKKNASGPCTFSQRQGYVDIDLRNGDTFSLRPLDKANHFKDQKGNKVVRTVSGNTHEYKWDGKKITVTLTGRPGNGYGSQNPGYGSGHRDPTGETPRSLSDLVGARAGQAEGAVRDRGYVPAGGSKSGGSSYTNWRETSTGRCVTIRTEQGRYKSIVYVPRADCGR